MNTNNLILFSSVLFFLGLFGIMTRKNILVILMSVELMLNAVNVAFVTYSTELHNVAGQLAVFFIITVAAAEAAVGLGLLIAMFRNLKSVTTEDIQLLKE